MDKKDLSTYEMEQKFFRDARVVKVDIEILEETYQLALEIFARNHWTPEEGLRIALTAGVGKMRADQFLSVEDTHLAESQDLADRLTWLESMYAVMKHRTFHLMRDNQALEFRSSASGNIISGLEAKVRRLERENLRLKALCRASDAAAVSSPADAESQDASPLPPEEAQSGVGHAVRSFFRKKRP